MVVITTLYFDATTVQLHDESASQKIYIFGSLKSKF